MSKIIDMSFQGSFPSRESRSFGRWVQRVLALIRRFIHRKFPPASRRNVSPLIVVSPSPWEAVTATREETRAEENRSRMNTKCNLRTTILASFPMRMTSAFRRAPLILQLVPVSTSSTAMYRMITQREYLLVYGGHPGQQIESCRRLGRRGTMQLPSLTPLLMAFATFELVRS